MNNLIAKGYAERAPEKNVKSVNRMWYIPHHGVYHPKKPGKIRIVFDCSATCEGKTLNQYLLSGPDLINNLTGVLLRFRKDLVAFTCDIEAMFHQVGVNEEDRDFLRFLWWENGDTTTLPVDYRMTVHLFGATSSPGCANFALKHVADTNKTFGIEASEFVKHDFYVDGGLKSVPTADEAVNLINASRSLCQSGGFNLHKYISNDRDVLNSLPGEIRAKNVENINLHCDSLPIERTLGVEWCVESDTFRFRITLNDKPSTRRGILSTVSSIYDPLGLVSPFLLTGKRILQELCKETRGWDDPIPEDIEVRWHKWKHELLTLSDCRIPRCYKSDNTEIRKVELHHFSDASSYGYGQCSYAKLIDVNNHVTVSLAMSKSRVAPVNTVTIPRMELAAAVVSVNVSQFLDKELKYSDITHVYSCDSNVVLGYIANESRRFHVYIANRVQQIHDYTTIDQWNYVNTSENPADIASRGISAKYLVNSDIWWRGPEFLSSSTLHLHGATDAFISNDDPEVKKIIVHVTKTDIEFSWDLLARLERFSSWFKVKRAVAVCLKFKNLLQAGKVKKPKSIDKFIISENVKQNYVCVNVEDMINAEKVILREVQRSAFPRELVSLQKFTACSNDRNDMKQRKHVIKQSS